jgi:hypothetical protein
MYFVLGTISALLEIGACADVRTQDLPRWLLASSQENKNDTVDPQFTYKYYRNCQSLRCRERNQLSLQRLCQESEAVYSENGARHEKLCGVKCRGGSNVKRCGIYISGHCVECLDNIWNAWRVWAKYETINISHIS